MLKSLLAVPRQLYDWTLRRADAPHALTALALVAFAEASFFPIPPDFLLIAIVAARPPVWLRAAAACAAGSFAGAAAGYAIGATLMAAVGDPIIAFYNAEHHWDRFVALADQWGIWFLAAAAFTPIPFKVATIAAGATMMPLAPFMATSLLGRAARFLLVAALLRIFGAPIRRTIENHFDLATVLFLAALIAGYLVLGVL